MAAPALTLVGPSALFIAGAVANLNARPMSLSAEKTWLPGGGFIGVLNGKSKGAAVATPLPATPSAGAASASSASAPASAPATGTNKPIGGRTGLPAPPTPFGRFKKHRPTKLPGPPKAYNPNSP